jgi:glycosyltransferase involved in cell wall biosynthesis
MSVHPRRSRSSSTIPDVLIVTAGDTRRRTGGNIYLRHLRRALRRAGLRVETRHVSDGLATRALIAIVDTLASREAAPHLARMRAAGTRVIALALMRQGALTLARRADRVISLSRSLASGLERAGVPRSRVRVVSPGRDGVPSLQGTATRDVRVLCVANWTPGKGVHTLLAAAARVPEVSIDLVGDAPDARYAGRVRRLIRRLDGRAVAHGSLGPQALARRYAAASIFALPSVNEGYGIVYAEALAHGLPVIACDIPAVREVTNGSALLVPPGRVHLLADAIRLLATSRASRASLARRSRSRARDLPTWHQTEAALVRVVLAEISAGRVSGARRTRAGPPS